MHSDTVIEACESQVALQEDLCASERDPENTIDGLEVLYHPELGDENQKKQFVYQRQRSS